MNEELLAALRELRNDPALVTSLYEQLFHGCFWALVEEPVAELENMSFLTYPTEDGPRELPIFTDKSRALLLQFNAEIATAMIVTLGGPEMWQRLQEVVRNGECEVAVDPGEPHGIRVTREMLLGMLNSYSEQDNGDVRSN